MIITPKQSRDDSTVSRLSKLVPYMLRGKGEERCTWYMAGNLDGLDRQKDAELAVDVMELLQEGNVRAKGNKTYHLVISFHPEDRRLSSAELEDVVRRAVRAAGLGEHQYVAVRHSDQEHEHLHVAVNKIHPQTLKIHHPYQAIGAFQALSSVLEEELDLYRVDRTRGRSQSYRARDFEAHRGIESFPRWARRNIGETKALDGIASWAALHEELKTFRRSFGAARERVGDRGSNEIEFSVQGIGLRTWVVEATALRALRRLRARPGRCRNRTRSSPRLRGAAARTDARCRALARVPRGPQRRTDSPHGAPRGDDLQDRRSPRDAWGAVQIEASRDCGDAHPRARQAQPVPNAFVREEVRRAQAEGDH